MKDSYCVTETGVAAHRMVITRQRETANAVMLAAANEGHERCSAVRVE